MASSLPIIISVGSATSSSSSSSSSKNKGGSPSRQQQQQQQQQQPLDSHNGNARTSAAMSQESKLSRTSGIRRSIEGKKRRQNAKDLADALAVKDGMQEAGAIRDIVESGHVPVFGWAGRQSSVGDFQLGSNSIRSEACSSILKSLRSIPRTMGPLTITDHEYQRKEKESGRGPPSEGDINTKLVAAVQLQKAARSVLDGSRLFFEAAVLFDEVGMLDRAIGCFERCAVQNEDAEAIVTAYDLGALNERKMERMSAGMREAFYKKRHSLRDALVAAERERARLRAMVSLCQLCRLYLQLDDHASSHRSLVAAFHCTSTFAEHTELLLHFNDTLKVYGTRFSELSLEQQLVRGSAGPLAEAHISILHELLEEDGADADTLEWLGRRYAERCNFEESRHYYRRARDLRHPVHVAEDLRSLYSNKPNDYDDAAYCVNISKAQARSFSMGNEKDVRFLCRSGSRPPTAGDLNAPIVEDEGRDFAWPQGAHEGRDTIIYRPPPQGWTHGIVAQVQRQELLGITFKLPPKHGKLLPPSDQKRDR